MNINYSGPDRILDAAGLCFEPSLADLSFAAKDAADDGVNDTLNGIIEIIETIHCAI